MVDGLVERAAAILAALTLKNVLIVALLAAVIVPAYVVWRYLDDEKLRREWDSSIEEVANMPVSCQVFRTVSHGRSHTHIGRQFYIDTDGEFFVVLSTQRPFDQALVVAACDRLAKYAHTLQETLFRSGGTAP